MNDADSKTWDLIKAQAKNYDIHAKEAMAFLVMADGETSPRATALASIGQGYATLALASATVMANLTAAIHLKE